MKYFNYNTIFFCKPLNVGYYWDFQFSNYCSRTGFSKQSASTVVKYWFLTDNEVLCNDSFPLVLMPNMLIMLNCHFNTHPFIKFYLHQTFYFTVFMVIGTQCIRVLQVIMHTFWSKPRFSHFLNRIKVTLLNKTLNVYPNSQQ